MLKALFKFRVLKNTSDLTCFLQSQLPVANNWPQCSFPDYHIITILCSSQYSDCTFDITKYKT